MKKVSKEDAEYGKGSAKQHCRICQHYLGGSCTKVQGEIQPDMWCKFWERRK